MRVILSRETVKASVEGVQYILTQINWAQQRACDEEPQKYVPLRDLQTRYEKALKELEVLLLEAYPPEGEVFS